MSVGWDNLPLEIRWMIIGYIRKIILPWPARVPLNSLLPLVCREWHGYFSHENFRIIVIDQNRLDGFRRFVSNNKPRRSFVEEIIFRVKLPEYDCSVCQTPEDVTTARANDAIFIKTLQKFMYIMLTWKPTGHGIKLDIGAYSPSDGQHGFRDFRFSEGYSYGATDEAYQRHALALANVDKPNNPDRCPGWMRACRGEKPLDGAKRRVSATIGDPQSPHFMSLFRARRFAWAPVFDSLVIRRHYYRHISSEILSRLIRQGLPNLYYFHNESWAYPELEDQLRRRLEYLDVLNALPDTVREVNLFRESNAIFTLQGSTWYLREIGWELGRALAVAATRFTKCSVSFLIDAWSFLRHSSSGDLEYPKLKQLTLTSRLFSRAELRPKSRDQALAVTRLILAATRTAYNHMPKLQFLDLWHTDNNGDSFMVRCCRDKCGKLSISWRSTWHRDAELRTIFRVVGEIWKWTQPQPKEPLHIRRRSFTEDTTEQNRWHSTIYPELLLHPESRLQVQQEKKLAGSQ